MGNKRVHEIAKERGLAAKDVLARLKAAGIDVKASSSSVDEDVASRVLANGGEARSDRSAKADGAPEKATAADRPKGRAAEGATAPRADGVKATTPDGAKPPDT